MSHKLCVCSALNNKEIFTNMFEKHLRGFFNSMIVGTNASDFLELKKSKDPIIMLVDCAAAYDVIKELCDDYNLEKEQRRVQWIYSFNVGVDSYRLSELTKQLEGIPFLNARGCFSSVLAEHVVYAIMYFNRRTWRTQNARAKRMWDRFNMVELRGQKVCIVGYGDIGRAAGKLCVAMGMEVTGVKRKAPANGDGNVDECGVRVVCDVAERDRAISEADVVLNILPGTESLRWFFNKERFATMKPSALYINIGRGLTQNENDLADALRNGVIRAAALDVFEKEPLPVESPLWDFGDNKVLLTAHCADWTDNLLNSAIDRFVGLVKEYEKTKKLDTYHVDPARGY